MLHARGTIDMLKLCKKPPLTEKELQKLKYDEMMRNMMGDPMPTVDFDAVKTSDAADD